MHYLALSIMRSGCLNQLTIGALPTIMWHVIGLAAELLTYCTCLRHRAIPELWH